MCEECFARKSSLQLFFRILHSTHIIFKKRTPHRNYDTNFPLFCTITSFSLNCGVHITQAIFKIFFSLSIGIRSEIMRGFELRKMSGFIPDRQFSKSAAHWDHTIRILIRDLIFKAHFSCAECIKLKLQKARIDQWSHQNEKILFPEGKYLSIVWFPSKKIDRVHFKGVVHSANHHILSIRNRRPLSLSLPENRNFTTTSNTITWYHHNRSLNYLRYVSSEVVFLLAKTTISYEQNTLFLALKGKIFC